jgi:hypothetical protein
MKRVSGTELAYILDLSPSTVRGYARKGLIPFESTPGGHRRYEPDAVQAALREERPRFAPVTPGEEPRFSSASESAPDLESALSWRPAITSAMIRDDTAPDSSTGPLLVPVIGVAGSSQFAVGQGARA